MKKIERSIIKGLKNLEKDELIALLIEIFSMKNDTLDDDVFFSGTTKIKISHGAMVGLNRLQARLQSDVDKIERNK